MEVVNTAPDFAFDILHQEKYSRGELLLRSLFGWLYIVIPHAFVLFFMQIAGGILRFLAWWIVLFTAKYPQSFFDFQVALLRWGTRLNARMLNLSDGYPAFGLNAEDSKITLTLTNPPTLSRGLLILRTLFGIIYVLIPHGFILLFRSIGMYFVLFIGWWVILITGTLPKGMFDFVVGTLRWGMRVSAYMMFLTDKYPPFSSK